MTGHTNTVYFVAYNPFDPTEAASGSNDNTAKLWNTTTGVTLQTLTGHTWAVFSVTYNPFNSSEILTSSSDSSIRIWNRLTGQTVQVLCCSGLGVRTSVFNPLSPNEVISCGYDMMIRVWDRTQGTMVRVYTGHTAPVTQILVNPTVPHELLSASVDQSLKLWDTRVAPPVQTLRTFQGQQWTDFRAVKFFPHGELFIAAGGTYTAVQLFNPFSKSSTPQQIYTGHTATVREIALDPFNATIFFSVGGATFRTWDCNASTALRTINAGATNLILAASPFTPGEVTFAGTDGVVRVCNAYTGVVLKQFTSHAGYIFALVYHPTVTNLLASGGDDGILRLWNVTSGSLTQFFNMSTTTSVIASLAFNPVNTTELLLGTRNDKGFLVDIVSGAILQAYSGHLADLIHVVFDPFDPNQLLTSSSDNTIRLWEKTTGKQLAWFVEHSFDVYQLAFSPVIRGEFLSASSDGSIRLWHLPDPYRGTLTPSATGTRTPTGTGTNTDALPTSVFSLPDGVRRALRALVCSEAVTNGACCSG
eukprot:TRINITY_DN16544_c0_g1_i2.p1 TRINITY_DN16544_c0_g1~~TRINITY_DN16544_c0_g1_i2.p1  ORF type:complete len:532 (-),score=84.61 TRINITY_DN16544_c0_g1_i2:137-1732(-)